MKGFDRASGIKHVVFVISLLYTIYYILLIGFASI